MAEITKNDIKEAVSEVLVESFPRLLAPFAVAIQKDFTEVKSDLIGVKSDVASVKSELAGVKKEMREGFIKVHDDISWIHGSLDTLRKEIVEIKENLRNVIYRHEFESLKSRIEEIEKKVGIK